MRRLFSVALAVSAVAFTACGGGEQTDPYACDKTDSTVTADQIYSGIIQPGNCASCHARSLPQASNAGLFLENLDDLKATAGKASGYSQTLKVVDAAHSENSTMYLMVLGGRDAKPTPIKGPEGQALGPQMPQGGTPLTEQQRADLKGWICAGAK